MVITKVSDDFCHLVGHQHEILDLGERIIQYGKAIRRILPLEDVHTHQRHVLRCRPQCIQTRRSDSARKMVRQ